MAEGKLSCGAPEATAGVRCYLGIDPGLHTTGYGVLEWTASGPRLLEAGVVRGKARGDLHLRVREIYEGVLEILKTFAPNAMALEDLYSHYAQPRTAILMGHARGVICLAAAQCEVPVVHYGATKVKKLLTGNGHAPKSQMQLAVSRELGLLKPPEPPDVADALAIALCHGYLASSPLADVNSRSAIR